jgi:hypothetical protein
MVLSLVQAHQKHGWPKTSRANVTKIVNWENTLSLLKKGFSIGTMNENVVAELFVTAYAGSAGVSLRNPKKIYGTHGPGRDRLFIFFNSQNHIFPKLPATRKVSGKTGHSSSFYI